MSSNSSSSQTISNVAAAATPEPLTFDGISKYFNMNIADAATALGVCSSVLKKICRDNGLVRWPYRKFLAGKSIEEIQKDAARERRREQIELARASKLKDAAATTFAASTISQQQGHSSWSNTQGSTSNAPYSGPIRSIPAYLDEFEQGFPSKGLSTVPMRWWGDASPEGNEDENLGEECATDEVNKQESHDAADNGGNFIPGEADKIPEKSDIGPLSVGLLSSVRRKAASEGREALNLGVYRHHPMFKLSRRENLLLLKVFKSCLPDQWISSS